MVFEPNVSTTREFASKRRLPILVDTSASMSVKDQRKRPADIAEAAAALGFMSMKTTTDTDQRVSELDGKQRRQIANTSRLELAKALLTKSARPVLGPLEDDLDVNYYAFGDSVKVLTHGEADQQRDQRDER